MNVCSSVGMPVFGVYMHICMYVCMHALMYIVVSKGTIRSHKQSMKIYVDCLLIYTINCHCPLVIYICRCSKVEVSDSTKALRQELVHLNTRSYRW